jgi:hypothetical protein
MTPSDPFTQAMVAALKAADAQWLGICPDFGCFIEGPSPAAYAAYTARGARPELLDHIVAAINAGAERDQVAAQVAARGGGPAEAQAIEDWFGFMGWEPADVTGFKALLPYCRYFHGKFYSIDAAGEESIIPHAALLGAIADHGFDGVVLTEYEGWQFGCDDAEEQVRRHLAMSRRILAGRR